MLFINIIFVIFYKIFLNDLLLIRFPKCTFINFYLCIITQSIYNVTDLFLYFKCPFLICFFTFIEFIPHFMLFYNQYSKPVLVLSKLILLQIPSINKRAINSNH